MDNIREVIARAAAPSRWAVMDAAKAETLKKYKGQNVGWPPDQFQDDVSLKTADAILSAIDTVGLQVRPKEPTDEIFNTDSWVWDEGMESAVAVVIGQAALKERERDAESPGSEAWVITDHGAFVLQKAAAAIRAIPNPYRSKTDD